MAFKEVEETPSIKVFESFKAMDLRDPILRGIHAHGFSTPSQIQSKAIVPIASSCNVIAQAQSGSGKTAAFTIGLLQRISEEEKELQVIILSPTRELAQQTYSVVTSLSMYMNVESHICIGGRSVRENREAFRHGAQVFIGTPGRLNQLIEEDPARLARLKTIVIDECDEMFSRGFRETVAEIIRRVPKEAQVVLTSATLDEGVLEMADTFVENAIKILLQKEQVNVAGIMQRWAKVLPSEKLDFLTKLLMIMKSQIIIIYCARIETCEEVVAKLVELELPAKTIHSKQEQVMRDQTMKDFRDGNVRYLVTTNLMSRGIDIQRLGVVINYDMPRSNEAYMHRVGRSGRYGRKGFALNIIACDADQQRLDEISAEYHIKMEELSEETIREWSAIGNE